MISCKKLKASTFRVWILLGKARIFVMNCCLKFAEEGRSQSAAMANDKSLFKKELALGMFILVSGLIILICNGQTLNLCWAIG